MELSKAINTVIENRKSIYPYQYEAGERVDDEVIWQILESANRAPNHKNTQPWRFTVFTGEGLQKFADMQVAAVKKHEPEAGEIKIKKLAEYPLMASHIIAIGMKRNANRVPEVEEVLAMGCAIENMFLTATAHGVGCYLSTGGMTYIDEAKEFFDLSEEDKLIGFFYVGVKKEMPEVVKQKGDIKEKVNWITG